MMPRFALMVAAVLAFVASPCRAEPDLAGAWAWQVEGRNTFLISLQRAASGWAGTFQRPRHFSMDANAGYWRVSDVSPEVTEVPLSDLIETLDGVGFSVSDSEEADAQPMRFVMRPLDATTGLLELPDVPQAPGFRLKRVSPDAVLATDWLPGQTYGAPEQAPDNAELARLFAEDQAPRQGATQGLNESVTRDDTARRVRVREILDAGDVRTGADYYAAAFIFQHGQQPDDYLLAHALAVAAIGRGRPDAIWISTATLDRYLQSIGRDQIYGTQFQISADAVTQGGYDRDLLPDSVRRDSGVPDLRSQQRQLETYQHAQP